MPPEKLFGESLVVVLSRERSATPGPTGSTQAEVSSRPGTLAEKLQNQRPAYHRSRRSPLNRGALALLLATPVLLGQNAVSPATSATSAAATPVPEDTKKAWDFSLSAVTVLVPDQTDYVQPTFMADRDWLHMEARYNYESLDTGSAWVGYNIRGGEKLSIGFTPMLGGVFGETSGAAIGFRGSMTWWKLQLLSEGEWFFDTSESSSGFFYSWSELSMAPVDWFRFGGVSQRTRMYGSDRDIQRGVLAGFSFGKLNLTTYLLNPDKTPIWMFAVGMGF